MGRKRKYPKVQGYWVYTIYIPSVAKYYVGVSQIQCCRRWNKCQYKGMALEPYLDEWDSMIKTVLIDGLTREEALKKEDELIQELKKNDLCINKQRSGLITNDINAYVRECHERQKQQAIQRANQQAKQRAKQCYLNKNMLNEEFREKKRKRDREYRVNNREEINRKRRERRAKKKLKKQQQNQNQLTLFDLAS